MSTEQRGAAAFGVVWGYGDEKLSEAELLELVTGVHGDLLAQRFIETLGRGMRPPAGGQIRSFAYLCVRYRRLDLLEKLVTTAKPIVAGAAILSTSAWLDRLCTRTTASGQVITFSLYQTGLEAFSAEDASAVFEFALKHQPEHPDLAQAMGTGTANAAVLTELVMARHLARQAAAAAPAGERVQSGVEPDSPQLHRPVPRSESDSSSCALSCRPTGRRRRSL